MSVNRRKGRAGWWVRLKHQGQAKKFIQRYGGPNKKDALQLEASLKQELKQTPTPRPQHDLNQFVKDDYWPAQQNHLTTRAIERERGILNNYIGPFFAGTLDLITPQRIISYITKRKATGASGDSIRKELNVLKHILRKAVLRELIDSTPFLKFDSGDLPPASPPRLRYLTEEEWGRLLPRVPTLYRPAIIFLINVGCRRGEMLALEWSEVDLDRGIATVRKDKRGMPKVVPLSPTVVKELRHLPRKEGDPRVFWMAAGGKYPGDWLSQVFRKACKGAGIENCRLHDLRHSFASQHIMHGTNLRILQDLLGHNDLRMTGKYAHLSQDHIQGARSIEGIYGTTVGEIERVN